MLCYLVHPQHHRSKGSDLHWILSRNCTRLLVALCKLGTQQKDQSIHCSGTSNHPFRPSKPFDRLLRQGCSFRNLPHLRPEDPIGTGFVLATHGEPSLVCPNYRCMCPLFVWLDWRQYDSRAKTGQLSTLVQPN